MLHSILRRRRTTQTANPTRLNVQLLDERILPSNYMVTNTAAYPSSAVGQVRAVWDLNRNGLEDDADHVTGGTGNLIGPSQVLTCAHCIYDTDPHTSAKGFASWITFTPGLNGTYEPFGHALGTTRMNILRAYSKGNQWADLGIVTLDQNIGEKAGWFSYWSAPSAYIKAGTTIDRLGYPGTRQAGYDFTRQYHGEGPISRLGGATIWYRNRDIPTVQGTSGSGVFLSQVVYNGAVYNNVIVGVNAKGEDTVYGQRGSSAAVRITPAYFDWIRSVIQSSGNSRLSAATPSANRAAIAKALVSAPPASGGATVAERDQGDVSDPAAERLRGPVSLLPIPAAFDANADLAAPVGFNFGDYSPTLVAESLCWL